MGTDLLRGLADIHGPFASVYLPPNVGESAWPTVRLSLVRQGLEPSLLDVLDAAIGRVGTAGLFGHALIAAEDGLLVDDQPSWCPPTPVARVSDLPYLLPLLRRHPVREPVPVGGGNSADDHGRGLFDQFVFEMSRPEGLALDGLGRCAELLRDGNADALFIAVDALGERTVWVGGTRRDQVADDHAALRAIGLPANSQRADEALPMAALSIGATVVVAPDNVSLTDGVVVLRQHP